MVQQSPLCQGFLIIEAPRSHAVRHPTTGRTSLDEGSARRIDRYLTTTPKRQKSVPPPPHGGIQTRNPTASEGSQTHALYHAAAGIGMQSFTILT
jgi:hypothetical protein